MNYSIFFLDAEGTEKEWLADDLDDAIDLAIEASSLYGRAEIVNEYVQTVGVYEMGEEVDE